MKWEPVCGRGRERLQREGSGPRIEEDSPSHSPSWAPPRGRALESLELRPLPGAALRVPGSRRSSPATSTATPSRSPPPGARPAGTHLQNSSLARSGVMRSTPCSGFRASARAANVAAGVGRPRPRGSCYRPGLSPPSTHQASGSAKSPRHAHRRETEALEGGDPTELQYLMKDGLEP